MRHGEDRKLGRLIYDPKKEVRFRRQKRESLFIGLTFSLVFGAVLLMVLLRFAGIPRPFESVSLAIVGVTLMVAFAFVIGLIMLTSSFKHDFFRVYEKGIRNYRGLLSEEASIPFGSVSKMYTNILDFEGDPTDIVVLELNDRTGDELVFLFDDDYIDLDSFSKSIGKSVRIDPEQRVLSDLKGTIVDSRGKLVFQEHPRFPLPSSRIGGLADVVLGRAFMLVVLVGAFVFLNYLVAKGTSNPGILSVLALALVLLTLAHQLFSGNVRSAQPVRVYENGIEMPATWFEKRFLQKGYLEWDEIETMFPLKNSIAIEDKIVRGVENQIVLIARNGRTYTSSVKDEREVKRIMGAISFVWPRYSREKARIAQLEDARTNFPNWFASLDQMSIIVPTVILDAFLFITLGVSIWADADTAFIVILVMVIITVDVIIGLVLAKIGGMKRQVLSHQ